MENFNKNKTADFSKGYQIVSKRRKYNWLGKSGDYLINLWFIRLNDQFNFTDGLIEPLSKIDDMRTSSNDVAVQIEFNNKWNYVNSSGNLLSETWFDEIGEFKDGFAQIKLNDEWNFIDSSGKVLFGFWFEEAGVFAEGYALVKLKGKWYFINSQGEFTNEIWFDDADISFGLRRARLNNKWNFMYGSGELLSQTWFDNIGYFFEIVVWSNDIAVNLVNLAQVQLNGKYNYIDGDFGILISDTWFENVEILENEFSRGELNDQNFLNRYMKNYLDKTRLNTNVDF